MVETAVVVKAAATAMKTAAAGLVVGLAVSVAVVAARALEAVEAAVINT